jgi:hypothetical protein
MERRVSGKGGDKGQGAQRAGWKRTQWQQEDGDRGQ